MADEFEENVSSLFLLLKSPDATVRKEANRILCALMEKSLQVASDMQHDPSYSAEQKAQAKKRMEQLAKIMLTAGTLTKLHGPATDLPSA